MAFVARYDNAVVGYVILPEVAHTLESLDFISEDTTQVTVIYNGIAIAQSAFIDARVIDQAEFWVNLYSVDKDAKIAYSKVFNAKAVSRSTDTVILDIVS